MVVQFNLNDHPFVGFNGGSKINFNETISFQIDSADQDEVDYYWDKPVMGATRLSAGVDGWRASSVFRDR